MTLVVRLFPPLQRMAAYQQRWMAALLLVFLLVLGIATKLDRFQYKRGNHNDHGDNLEVRHDLTSFNFRIQR